MLHKNLTNPSSIAVVGGSDNLQSPGGSVLNNLLTHHFKGDLYVVNPKKNTVQGLNCVNNTADLPQVDLAIIAIAAKYTLEIVKILAETKNTKAFIIYSAGFSEKDTEGLALEKDIAKVINQVGGSLLGPNNIGLINQHFAGVFTKPIPKLQQNGVDFISGSGATAVFIIEAAMQLGLPFSSIYTVGNSAQIGVEEVLEHFDETYKKGESSPIKLLYIESVNNPQKLLKHAQSLIKKGCKIAAIKAGSTAEGSRAASSHTGALANSDMAVDALFKKAGIVRCYGRNELIHVATVFMYPCLKGKNIAIVTHAGGPAVMLTDVLSKNNLNVPKIEGNAAAILLEKLFDGSSVANPIDFLATGTAAQLDAILNACETQFEDIDAVAVIFGSPGLTQVFDVYNVLDKHINMAKKPIYPILPSVVNVRAEIADFKNKGHVIFTDEVLFGKALATIYNTDFQNELVVESPLNKEDFKACITPEMNGFLAPKNVKSILDLAGIVTVDEIIVQTKQALQKVPRKIDFPMVMKVVGPIHKTDVGGVVLNIDNERSLNKNFEKLIQIPEATSVLIQPMLKGTELFIGVKKEGAFGHLILCGLGGVFVEILKDISIGLLPISKTEAMKMIKNLKAYPLLKGYRGKPGINLELFASLISKVSLLVKTIPEITEIDINPLIATGKNIIAVDARISIEN
ncbi:MAG: acetate--CoA ligase family protein [Flavobacteriaceae bacterium]|nr:acetate--CoA ligase family protein [Flavobacteriaceae bacterium]